MVQGCYDYTKLILLILVSVCLCLSLSVCLSSQFVCLCLSKENIGLVFEFTHTETNKYKGQLIIYTTQNSCFSHMGFRFRLTVCLSVCLSVCLPVCLPACLLPCLSVCVPVWLSVLTKHRCRFPACKCQITTSFFLAFRLWLCLPEEIEAYRIDEGSLWHFYVFVSILSTPLQTPFQGCE
jgi:hypothetical protein